MITSVDNSFRAETFVQEKNVRIDEDTGKASAMAVAPKHPRDDMPNWKWATTQIVILSLSTAYGYDVSNVANIQARVYEAFGHIDLLPWIALSFTTANFASIPLVRRLTGIVELRLLLATCIIIFLVGAAICGAAQNINTLIAGRAINGVGSCGVYQTMLVYATTFGRPLEVPRLMGLLGMSYSLGLVVGPIIGGAFAGNDHTTWRWAFYINLPICGVCLLAVVFGMPSYQVPSHLSLGKRLAQIDWVGVVLHIASIVLLTVALTMSGAVWPWNSGSAIAAWVVCGLVWIAYAVQQSLSLFTTPERRAFPVHLLTHRTIGLLFTATCAIAFCHGLALYYLPLYYAFAKGYAPLTAAVRLLPYIGVLIVASICTGIMLPKLGRYNIAYLTAGTVTVIAGSLMTQIVPSTSDSAVMGYGAIIGFGVGLSLTHGLGIANVLVPPQDRFDAAALFNMAQIGAVSIVLAVAGCIYQNVGFNHLSAEIAAYEANAGKSLNLTEQDIREALAGVASRLWEGGDAGLAALGADAVTSVISRIFFLVVAGGAMCLVCALFMKWERLVFGHPAAKKTKEATEAA
ncbi:unnamed protein product [Discula destructiva]